tara:strand:- start:3121 stop:4548 length:1428 start_codon:yes stop_codon:yes gene_type:complete
MAATIEIKYFNTFWLKKVESITSAAIAPVFNNDTAINKSTNLPRSYTVAGTIHQPTYNSTTPDWYIEESRIRGGYNNTNVDLGVKAYLVEEFPAAQHRFNSLIYSGIYNSRTGINNTNQFPVGESITKSADPAYVSIQKLYAEDTNLIIFQEDKVSRALIDKDAIYSAEGNASITSTSLVIGQIIPYKGEYGISKDPFSFAIYGYRKYFTDRKRNCVLRLSLDGMTEISSYGMHDFLRDELSATATNKIVAGFNEHTKDYTLSIQKSDNSYSTLAFDEQVRGWVSLYDYQPGYVSSLGSNFYSFYKGRVFKHYIDQSNQQNPYGKFYNYIYNSDVTVVFNSEPSLIKTFQTINYEGSIGWGVVNLPSEIGTSNGMKTSSGDVAFTLSSASTATIPTLAGLESNFWTNNFKEKEGKFFANLINNSSAISQEILWGKDTTGIKGYFATVKFSVSNATYATTKSELYAVSTNYVESSY